MVSVLCLKYAPADSLKYLKYNFNSKFKLKFPNS